MSVGFFWNETYEPDTDESRGREMLLAFHQENIGKSNYPFNSLEQLLDHYGSHGTVMAEGLGLTQRILPMDLDDAKDVMAQLGRNSNGKIPQNWMAFNNALKDKAMNPSFIDAVLEVGKDTIVDTVDVVSNVGEGVINTLKVSKWLIPGLAILGGYIFVKSYAKKPGGLF